MTDSAANFVADTLEQSTSQFLGALTQTTKFMLETVSALAEAFSKTPLALPQLPTAPGKETVKEWLDVSFETTQQLLKLQHELATEMVERLSLAAAS
jgi:hypothetical protein